MPKSLEDAKTALKALEGGAELLAVVNETITGLEGKVVDLTKSVDTEKQRGIRESSQRNQEVEKLKPFKKAIIDGLGYDADSGELDSFVDGLKETISSRKPETDEEKVKASQTYKDVALSLKKMQTQLDTAQQKTTEAEEKQAALHKRTINTHIKSTLVATLDPKVYGADLLADNLISAGRVRVSEEDEKKVIFVDGENEVEYDAGVTKLLETRKDIVKNDQQGGGGSGGGGGGGKDKKKPSDQTEAERTAHLRGLGHVKI